MDWPLFADRVLAWVHGIVAVFIVALVRQNLGRTVPTTRIIFSNATGFPVPTRVEDVASLRPAAGMLVCAIVTCFEHALRALNKVKPMPACGPPYELLGENRITAATLAANDVVVRTVSYGITAPIMFTTCAALCGITDQYAQTCVWMLTLMMVVVGVGFNYIQYATILATSIFSVLIALDMHSLWGNMVAQSQWPPSWVLVLVHVMFLAFAAFGLPVWRKMDAQATHLTNSLLSAFSKVFLTAMLMGPGGYS